MTIQASVVIWTVLCFILLVLILNNLLFKPVLEIMDRRKARIENAAKKQAEYDRMAQEHEALLAQARREELEKQKKQVNEELDRIRTDGRAQLMAANEARLHRVVDYRYQAQAECIDLLATLSEHADELAVSFAESLTR